VSWDGLSGQLTRSLCQYAPAGLRAAEARVLAPLIEQAIGSGHRATEQLESVRVGSALHTPGEAAHG
jgi:hypothetical protein